MFQPDSQHTYLPWGVFADLSPFPCLGLPQRVGAAWLQLQALGAACVASHEWLWRADINHSFPCALTPRPPNTIPGTAQPRSMFPSTQVGGLCLPPRCDCLTLELWWYLAGFPLGGWLSQLIQVFSRKDATELGELFPIFFG